MTTFAHHSFHFFDSHVDISKFPLSVSSKYGEPTTKLQLQKEDAKEAAVLSTNVNWAQRMPQAAVNKMK